MKRYWAIVALVFLFFLTFFLLVEYLSPTLFSNLDDSMENRNAAAAFLGIGLLAVDVLLPIPSSLIMISNGALFGIWLGTLLSVIGSLCAATVGFLIGRWGGPLVDRIVVPEERLRTNQLLDEWGWLAILITRPLPLLAETTIVMAGASMMGWKTMFLASVAGSIPVALLYAITGATAAGLDNLALSFGLVLLMAGLFWLVGRRFRTMFAGKLKGEVR